MKRSIPAIAGIAAVALSLAACGSDDKGSSDKSSYCDLVASFKTDTDKVSELFNSATPDTDAVKKAFESMKPKIAQLLAGAPDEIKADLQLATEAQVAAISLFEQYDYDLATLSTSPEFSDLQTKYDTPEQTAAGDRLDAWAKDTCGIDMGS